MATFSSPIRGPRPLLFWDQNDSKAVRTSNSMELKTPFFFSEIQRVLSSVSPYKRIISVEERSIRTLCAEPTPSAVQCGMSKMNCCKYRIPDHVHKQEKYFTKVERRRQHFKTLKTRLVDQTSSIQKSRQKVECMPGALSWHEVTSSMNNCKSHSVIFHCIATKLLVSRCQKK